MNSKKLINDILMLVALLFGTMISTAMVFMRGIYSGQLLYKFLVWNLILAWLPLIFSWLVYRFRQKITLSLTFGLLWLLFFPNAPYLVTDLIHLRYSSSVPLWFDAIMVFSFALIGLLLGLLSLYLMQIVVSNRFSRAIGWLFAVASLSLSSYGVYIGRFLRWNSWDIFSQPVIVFNDIVTSLVHPQMFLKTVTVSLLLSAIFLFAYLIFFSLPGLALSPNTK